MKQRRNLAALLLIALLGLMLSGCALKQDAPAAQTDAPLSVYATFYPIYALADMLSGGAEHLQLHCLIQPQDGCLRGYQLSDWDLALAASADLIIAGGRGLEGFENILYSLGDQGPAVSAVLYNLELREQRGWNTQEDSQSHWLDPNPHIYMSADGALSLIERIAASLKLIDSENEAVYTANLEAGKDRIAELQRQITEMFAPFQGQKVILFNEAFVYSAQDYGLKAVLCYDRESGQELSESELKNCIERMNRSGARVVFIEKQAPQSLGKALEENGFSIAYMDTMSTRRAEEGYEGYLTALLENARAAMEALTSAYGGAE